MRRKSDVSILVICAELRNGLCFVLFAKLHFAKNFSSGHVLLLNNIFKTKQNSLLPWISCSIKGRTSLWLRLVWCRHRLKKKKIPLVPKDIILKSHSDSELGSLFVFLLFPKSYTDADKKEAGLRSVGDPPCLVGSDMISCLWVGGFPRGSVW